MTNLDKEILKEAREWSYLHGERLSSNYYFTSQALVNFVKLFMMDAVHDSNIQEQLLKEENDNESI